MSAANLPQWKCHKVVRAAKILELEEFGMRLILDSGAKVQRPKGAAFNAELVGGYYVDYEDGYTSWSPAAAFEAGYALLPNEDSDPLPERATTAGLNFGSALMWLKAGKRVARSGWNGKGMWLQLQVPDEHSKMTHPYIYIEYPSGHPAYPSGSRVPWLASQTDALADDWMVVE